MSSLRLRVFALNVPLAMFKIKICGITTPEDALLAADAGADAIGLNFYEKSPRYVSPKQTEQIWLAMLRIAWSGAIGGVFVNMDTKQIFEGAGPGIKLFQIHGDESPTLIAELREIFDSAASLPPPKLSWYDRMTIGEVPPVRVDLVRAVRLQSNSLDSVRDYLNQCRSAGGLPHAVLLDAHSAASYGGTGQTIDWNMIRGQRDKLLGLPLILAGGLTPENVAEAIDTARPDAVDVASGVESSPGKKDPAKVRDFIAAAKEAFAQLGVKS